jgi:acyl-CoA thioester hydrolase
MLTYHAPIDAPGLRALGIPEPWAFGLADRVRFAEIDALGHVNNTAYLTWFESFRLPYLEARGVTDYGPESPRLVLKRASVDYRAEMFNGMDYVVTGRTSAFRTTSFTMDFAVWLPDPQGAACAATGQAIVVLLNRGRAGPFPDPDGRPPRLHRDRRRGRRNPLIPFIFLKNTQRNTRPGARRHPVTRPARKTPTAASSRLSPPRRTPPSAPVPAMSQAPCRAPRPTGRRS